MNKQQILTELQSWAVEIEATSKAIDQWQKLLGVNLESPLLQSYLTLQEAYTAAVGDLVGDDLNGWLLWFWLDNKMGKRGLEAAVNDEKPKPIKTLKHLAELILKEQQS